MKTFPSGDMGQNLSIYVLSCIFNMEPVLIFLDLHRWKFVNRICLSFSRTSKYSNYSPGGFVNNPKASYKKHTRGRMGTISGAWQPAACSLPATMPLGLICYHLPGQEISGAGFNWWMHELVAWERAQASAKAQLAPSLLSKTVRSHPAEPHSQHTDPCNVDDPC